jgi:hypothetical protein
MMKTGRIDMNSLIILLLMLSLTAQAETVYKFTNGQGNIEFSSEKPPLGITFEAIDMETRETASASPIPVAPASMSLIPPGIPVAEPPMIPPPTMLETPPTVTQATQPPVTQPDETRYQQVRKDLYEICDHLKYGSIERRKCRADAKQIFHDKCHDKDTPVSTLYRQAYCSLSDSYPIVE